MVKQFIAIGRHLYYRSNFYKATGGSTILKLFRPTGCGFRCNWISSNFGPARPWLLPSLYQQTERTGRSIILLSLYL